MWLVCAITIWDLSLICFYDVDDELLPLFVNFWNVKRAKIS